jgi:signal transduction histidine kinase/CheY-like chemotaxis protein
MMGDQIDHNSNWLDYEMKRLENILEYDIKGHEKNDPGLLALCKLAVFITKIPMSFVTIVGYDYVDFISRFGSPLNGTCKQNSMCSFAIDQNNFFEVEDTLKDDRFKGHPSVEGEIPLRYYGGWPLKTPDGFNIGVFCVCDFVPRKLNPKQIEYLRTLTNQVMAHLVLKRQNNKLNEINLKTERLSQYKNEFIKHIGEEIRTPLKDINKSAEFIKSTKLNRDQQEAVDIIKNSTEMHLNLMNDILDFSNIKSQRLTVEKVPFELKKTIKSIYDLLLIKAQEKNISLKLKFDETIPKILLGDKIRINQIIMNLAGNALKFTEKGSVTISVKQKKETDHQLVIYFAIKDTGIGIKENKLNFIFRRYEQAELDTTRNFGGTGLGLSISKNLVELHGGKLKVKSEYGQGSTFYFNINYNKIKEGDNSQANLDLNIIDQNLSYINNLHILVCEDNLTNIKLIEHFFHKKVAHLEIVQNGKEATEILHKKTFDAILMDIHMPVMDGIEATKYIRNEMKLTLPIVGFTANNFADEKELCLEIGMNDYIKKSFIANEIYSTLESLVSIRKKYEEHLNSKKVNSQLNEITAISKKLKSKNSFSSKNLGEIFKSNLSSSERESLYNVGFNSNSSFIFKRKNSSNFFSTTKTNSPKSRSLSRSFDTFSLLTKTEMKSSKMKNLKVFQNDSGEDGVDSPIFNKNTKKSSKLKCKNWLYKKENIKKEEYSSNDNLTNINIVNYESSSYDGESILTNKTNKRKKSVIIHSNGEEVLNIQGSLDHVELNLLNDFSGDDKEFEKDLMENFLLNFPKDIKNLEIYIKTKNSKETKFWIHKIKSPLGIFGLNKILDKLQNLNKLCENNFEDVQILKIFNDIEYNMEIIYKELIEILKNY